MSQKLVVACEVQYSIRFVSGWSTVLLAVKKKFVAFSRGPHGPPFDGGSRQRGAMEREQFVL